MESAEDIVLRMNEMLEDNKFSKELFDSLLKSLKEFCNPALKILDFEYYCEKRLKKIRREKIKYIKVQDFEKAAEQRELEKECQNYITIRTEYKIQKSTFLHDKGYLFYFHLGTAKNDKEVKRYFKDLDKCH